MRLDLSFRPRFKNRSEWLRQTFCRQFKKSAHFVHVRFLGWVS